MDKTLLSIWFNITNCFHEQYLAHELMFWHPIDTGIKKFPIFIFPYILIIIIYAIFIFIGANLIAIPKIILIVIKKCHGHS